MLAIEDIITSLNGKSITEIIGCFGANTDFTYIGEGVSRIAYKYKDVCVKVAKRQGEIPTNIREFETLNKIFRSKDARLKRHFPRPLFATIDYSVIVVEYIPGKSLYKALFEKRIKENYSSTRKVSSMSVSVATNRLNKILSLCGIVPNYNIRDIHYNNIILNESTGKRVFVDIAE